MAIDQVVEAPISPATVPGRSVRRRRRTNRAVWVVAGITVALVAAPVVSVVVSVVGQGVAHWHWDILTTQTVGTGGGLENAIVGTLLIVALVLVLAGAIGVAGGVYLAEFCPPRRASFLRGASEVLSGVPSIVLGYVGYTALVVTFHWGFSLAGAVAVLSILVLPYMVKSTEVAITQVPTAYREGATALGFTQSRVVRQAVLRPALPGIATGLIVGVAIALGETAPLLYTAGWSDNLPTGQLLHSPVGYLPYAVWTFFQAPIATERQLAHEAALLLVLLVALFLLLSRVVVGLTQRHAPGRPARRRRRSA